VDLFHPLTARTPEGRFGHPFPQGLPATQGLTFCAEKLIVTPLMPGGFHETLLDPRLVQLSE
jgi:hypothetical protein